MIEMACEGRLEIVSGDTYDILVEVENYDVNLIEKIVFSCKDLNLVKDFDRDWTENSNLFALHFDSEETKNFPPKCFDYDITVIFTDGTINTATYRSAIKIYPKVNKI